ncbi:MAG: NADH-quinone oxidoreductase subunit NuoG [Pseudomonadota bacterium]
MSDDGFTIEVDGEEVVAHRGQMIIEVTDKIGAYVPRFCYHEKLSVAANCRMCLVEVEKAPKPLPACATPVGPGMKISTRSRYAQEAQKATMEFLLINHPLDCPICDQGGECELQDLAMGFGRGVSRYTERKRVVKDKDIGPLVSTDMTRCIHCTRCVRFGEEITGQPELGTTERGEQMKIGTYIETSIDHELSANIIDLCPVGALNNKPYRYSARAWEMLQRPTVSAHDCVGSNLSAHVLRGTIKRVVPRDNDDINETWISDRDRFSYEGIYSSERLMAPRVRSGKTLDVSDWETALQQVADKLRDARGDEIGFVVSPSATVEEGQLLSELARHLGTHSLDHRLRAGDTSDQKHDPIAPTLGCSINEFEASTAVLVAGSNLRREAPILAHRLRKASLNGASINFVNDTQYEFLFEVAGNLYEAGLVAELAGVAVACGEVSAAAADICAGVEPTDAQRDAADALKSGEVSRVVLGNIAARHPAAAALRALAGSIAAATGSTLGYISEGANSVGLHLTGILPHRTAGGASRASEGQTVREMVNGGVKVLMIFGAEPGVDMPAVDATKHEFVVGLSPFRSRAMEEACDVLLPIGTFAETSGTFVNCESRWQSFGGVASPVGEARPAWKVLRVLGNLLGADGFAYESTEEVLRVARDAVGEPLLDTVYAGGEVIAKPNGNATADASIDVPMYEIDSVVRRASALQLTPEARRSRGESV